jgi:hypothetical protein
VAIVPQGQLDKLFPTILLGVILVGLTCATITVYGYHRVRISKNKAALGYTKKNKAKARYYLAEDVPDNMMFAGLDVTGREYVVFQQVVLQRVNELGLDGETEDDLLKLLSTIASEARMSFLDETYSLGEGQTIDP